MLSRGLGVARMGERANYRPPGWQPGSERVSLEALETAFGPAQPGNEPNGANAHVRQPGVSAPRPGTNPGPSWPALVATTVRLWLRRRGEALGGLFRRHRVIAPAVLAATALVASGLAVAFIGPARTPPPRAGTTAPPAAPLR